MRPFVLATTSAILLTVAAPHQSTAATIRAQTNGFVLGQTLVDEQGPATSGELTAHVEFVDGHGINLTGPAYADAGVNDEGRAAVHVEGGYKVTGSLSNRLEASTSWSTTVTNNLGVPQRYLYLFTIDPIQLLLRDDRWNLGPNSPDAPSAEYGIEVRLDGVVVFSSHATLIGGGASHELRETGTDLGGAFSGDPSSFGYLFDTFHGMVPLGPFQPGASFTVETTLLARTQARLLHTGGVADIGDPLDLKGDPGIDSAIIPDEEVSAEPTAWGALKALYRSQSQH
jgi:hypothetical protein